jgi:hypothetical protein
VPGCCALVAEISSIMPMKSARRRFTSSSTRRPATGPMTQSTVRLPSPSPPPTSCFAGIAGLPATSGTSPRDIPGVCARPRAAQDMRRASPAANADGRTQAHRWSANAISSVLNHSPLNAWISILDEPAGSFLSRVTPVLPHKEFVTGIAGSGNLTD